MKRALVTVLGSAALLVGASQTARADAFLSLANGVTTLSCNTSIAFSAVNCGAGFTAVLGGNTIGFAGAVGGYVVGDVALATNQPGGTFFGIAQDTKTAVANVSGGASSLTVLFAVNGFTGPAGTPLTLSASQSASFGNASIGSNQAFQAWGNAANTLATATGGSTVITPNCINTVVAPPAQACASVGPATAFARAGAYALNGREIITLNEGGIGSFTGTIVVTPPNTVPEPGTYVLMATGLIALAGGRRVLRRKA